MPKPQNTGAEPTPQLELRKPDIFDDEEALRSACEIKVSLRPVVDRMSVIKSPRKGTHFQCHSDPKMRLESAAIIVDPTDDAQWFVAPKMMAHPLVLRCRKAVTITPVFSLPGNKTAIWPVPILPENRTPFAAHETWRNAYLISSGQPVKFKREATEHRAVIEPGETPPGPTWLTMWYDDEQKAVLFEEAEGIHRTPAWSGLTLGAMLHLAFNGRILNSDNLDIMRRLRGLYD
jgi:hypothetical protein